jgi:geranylgeranylglycerol-phosphate geranylgeranyltransferase
VHPALRLVRAGNLAVSFVGVLVGGLAALGTVTGLGSLAWIDLGLAAVSTALVTAGGNVLNDVLDRDGDRVNHPDRPLVTGEISVGRAKALGAALFVLGVAVAVPVAVREVWIGPILAVAVGALLGYEFVLKARGFVGNLVVALLTGLVFLYGGAAVGAPLLVAPFAGMAFLATLSRELIKDMEDVRGDVGRSTLPKTRGMGVATGLARGSVVAAVALSASPLLWFVRWDSVAGIIYLGLVLVADGLFVLSVAFLPSRLHWEQTVSKVAMTVALFAFLAVAFR